MERSGPFVDERPEIVDRRTSDAVASRALEGVIYVGRRIAVGEPLQSNTETTMFDLIASGGLTFTLPLALLFLAILALAVKQFSASKSDQKGARLLLHLGVFSAVFGILGQAIGLYQTMGVIESVGAISPPMLAGGLKISFIAPMFGFVNLGVAVAIFAALKYKANA